jgi:hypothetical protein
MGRHPHRDAGHLPLSLLVTFLVPLIIADHVVVFWRVIGRAPSQN